jgi:hypothetical protein
MLWSRFLVVFYGLEGKKCWARIALAFKVKVESRGLVPGTS